MVSIPERTKFAMARLKKAKTPAAPSLAKYYKEREEGVIKAAEKSGFFLTLTKEFIEDALLMPTELEEFIIKKGDTRAIAYEKRKNAILLSDKDRKRNYGLVMSLHLSNHQVRYLGDVGICFNLRICILSENHIFKIDPLVNCVKLVKLDLHSNLISVLPGKDFWSRLSHLKILHLNDNPIGKLQSLQHLAACPNLTILTLQDTPLSIKRNYRHHVVNSLWSLKALDRHVISDEEIIEDADFGGKYAAMSSSFKLNLCLITREDAPLMEEARATFKVLRDVNRVLSTYSPVLMIQKHIRGFLARRRLSQDSDRLWGAIAGKKRLAHWPNKSIMVDVGPPPPSPSPVVPSLGGIDYDTYIQNRRPGSVTALSEFSKPMSRVSSAFKSVDLSGELADYPHAPLNSAVDENYGNTRVYINLSKLHSGTMQLLQDQTEEMAKFKIEPAIQINNRTRHSGVGKHRHKKGKSADTKFRRIKDISHFFGKMVESTTSPEPDTSEPEDIPLINYRLKGLQQNIHYGDPLTDLLIGNRELAEDIRFAEDEYHMQMQNRPKPTIIKEPRKTDNERLFERAQGTMSMTCLNAVHKAYKDRQKVQRKQAQLEAVQQMKENREQAKELVRLHCEDRRQSALSQKQKDDKRLQEIMGQQEVHRINAISADIERKNKSTQLAKVRQRDRTFISDFSAQNTSVSNALLRHDRQAKIEEKHQMTYDRVRGMKFHESEQQDVVKKYLEHRQLMRQTETAVARSDLDSRMLQEANDRLMNSRSRVAQKKARNYHVESYYKDPRHSAKSLPPVSTEVQDEMHGLDRWHSTLLMNSGHVGRHHTSVR